MEELYQRLLFANPGACPTCKRAGACSGAIPCAARYPKEGTFEAWLLSLPDLEFRWVAEGPFVATTDGQVLAPSSCRGLLQRAFAAGGHAAFERVAERKAPEQPGPKAPPPTLDVICMEALALAHVLDQHLPAPELHPLVVRVRQQLTEEGRAALAMFLTAPRERKTEGLVFFDHVLHDLMRQAMLSPPAAALLAELRALRGRCSCEWVAALEAATDRRAPSSSHASDLGPLHGKGPSA